MEVRVVGTKTTAALEQDGSLRCLLEIKYKHRDRHSVPAIAEVSRTLLKGAGLDAEGDASAALLMVSLGEHRYLSYICYDILLNRCSTKTRDELDKSTRQPVHVISKRGGVFIAHRGPKFDQPIAQRHEHFKEMDNGPQPYFSDSENPPFYDEGCRVEEPWGEDAKKFEDEADDDDETVAKATQRRMTKNRNAFSSQRRRVLTPDLTRERQRLRTWETRNDPKLSKNKNSMTTFTVHKDHGNIKMVTETQLSHQREQAYWQIFKRQPTTCRHGPTKAAPRQYRKMHMGPAYYIK